MQFQIITRGQRESLFQLQDENENFSYSISHIETRREFLDTWSQASRRDREKFFFNLGHRDEIQIYHLHSQASMRICLIWDRDLKNNFSWSSEKKWSLLLDRIGIENSCWTLITTDFVLKTVWQTRMQNITLEMMSDSVHIIYAGLPNEIQNSTLIFRSNLWRFVRSGDLSITSETRAGISQAGPSRPSLTFQSKITPSQINQTAIKIFVTLIKIFATFIEQ